VRVVCFHSGREAAVPTSWDEGFDVLVQTMTPTRTGAAATSSDSRAGSVSLADFWRAVHGRRSDRSAGLFAAGAEALASMVWKSRADGARPTKRRSERDPTSPPRPPVSKRPLRFRRPGFSTSPPSGATSTCIKAWSPPLDSHAQEEADHLPAGVGSARVRVGAAGAAAGPSMARAVKDPLLKDLPAGEVELDRAGISHAAWRLAMRHHLGPRRLLPCLGDDVVAVARVDGPVGIAMEHDGRYRPSSHPSAEWSRPRPYRRRPTAYPGPRRKRAPNGRRRPRKHQDRWQP
jgi:hypothetical protein